MQRRPAGSRKLGRPNRNGYRVVGLTTYVGDEEAAAFHLVANALRMSASELIHDAIEDYLTRVTGAEVQHSASPEESD